jgi:hypothetical protein
MPEPTGQSNIPDPDDESLGPAMRALNRGQRRFAMAAVIYPLAKDWQIAKAAGYSDRSHGALRVAAHRLFHDDKVLAAIKELADKEIRGSALLGIATMKKIARADGHKDQLKAASGLVGLAGLTAEQKITVNQTLTDRTGAAIEARIRQLAQKHGLDAMKLLGVAPIEGEFSVVEAEE